MKYFLDTEFIEAGRRNPVTLISIGIIAEDGRSFYAISSEFNPDDANDWVKANVLTRLNDMVLATYHLGRVPVAEIAHGVRSFVGKDKPEFWGYYADYDWVVFCQMFGAMIDLPKGWPMYCRDLKQFADNVGNPKLPEQGKGEHNALADAKWNKAAYEFLDRHSLSSGAFQIAAERIRQINEEGWTPEHDDGHDLAQMAIAGLSYASVAASQVRLRDGCITGTLPTYWPWSQDWWKPSPDPIRNLVKSGALIAAEIDRLQRKTARGER